MRKDYSRRELGQVAQDFIVYELTIHQPKEQNLDRYHYDKFRKRDSF